MYIFIIDRLFYILFTSVLCLPYLVCSRLFLLGRFSECREGEEVRKEERGRSSGKEMERKEGRKGKGKEGEKVSEEGKGWT